LAGKIGVSYFGIFYGPGLQNGAGFQPAANGTPDQERPLILKNFLGVGYNFTDTIGVMPTAYWTFQPVMGMQFALKDPFIRLYDSSLLSAGNFNLYTDFRTHFGVSSESRTNDMYAGLQTFQIATYEFPTAKLTAGLYLSERVNFFGKQGLGNDFEMYVGPNVSYQVLKPLAVSLLAEFQFNHAYGDKPGQVWTDPIDLEPGLIWDVTENLMINPYFNLYPASLTAKSTSVGMMLSWKIM
ncbi:MAG: hypothetical protein ACXWOH_13010, partial [Bdellovibrionota bacterium]